MAVCCSGLFCKAQVSYRIVLARCCLISASNFLPYSIIASRRNKRCFALVLKNDEIPVTRLNSRHRLSILPVFFQRAATGRFAFAMQGSLPASLGKLGHHPWQVVVVGEAVANKQNPDFGLRLSCSGMNDQRSKQSNEGQRTDAQPQCVWRRIETSR